MADSAGWPVALGGVEFSRFSRFADRGDRGTLNLLYAGYIYRGWNNPGHPGHGIEFVLVRAIFRTLIDVVVFSESDTIPDPWSD